MKQKRVLLLAVVLLLALTSCGAGERAALPFDPGEVRAVELYHGTVPADAEKKVLTDQGEIAELVRAFSGVKLREKTLEPLTGTTFTSFRFLLADGRYFQVFYITGGERYGTFRRTGDTRTWATASDVEALWRTCGAVAVPAEEAELPVPGT